MSSLSPSFEQLKHRLHVAMVLNAAIIAAEFAGGIWINSVGLMSDAGHNFVDQGSLFLALYAHMLAARPASDSRTFGLHRAGTIAAFVNALVLLVTAVAIGFLALKRLWEPVMVQGGWVMLIALGSFAANLGIALLLQRGARDDLNIRSAFWHMLADAWVSLGVVASGGAILMTGWTWLDPLVSLVIMGVIIKGAWPLFRESLEVLLEATPPHISPAQVVATIESVPGVKNVHDLHVWAVEPRLIMLTCHVLVDGDDSQITNGLLRTIRSRIIQEFGITHMTVQLETHCCHPEVLHCDLNRLSREGGSYLGGTELSQATTSQ